MTKIECQHAIIGAVVIGRNEGQRLLNCFDSLLRQASQIIYVDSGSTDNSVSEAKKRGIHSISLDLTISFTAARARNEGANYLIDCFPDVQFIQFIDGDCELQLDWLEQACSFLEVNPEYAVACGRRRERFPEKSIYNQLCDIEWNTVIGEALACGGDALIRVDAFKAIGGYNGELIAGEEPEMCFRLRHQGWKIRRIDAEMTLHDAAMTKVGQWWNRAKRAGYAYASSFYLHGSTAEKFKRKELLSIISWALVAPVVIVVLSMYRSTFTFLVLVYPIQILRIVVKNDDKGLAGIVGLSYATSVVTAKWPQLLGIMKFCLDKLSSNKSQLIEYK